MEMEGFEAGNNRFDIAKWIMSSLHVHKAGVRFDLVAIFLRSREGGWHDFNSRLNDLGEVVHWESGRFGAAT